MLYPPPPPPATINALHLKKFVFSSFEFSLIVYSVILLFGVYPEPLLNTVNISVDNLINNYEMNLKFHLALRGN